MPIVLLIPLILQILAALPPLIQGAEAAFGGKDGSSTGKGAAKKDFVLAAIGTAVDVANATGEVSITPQQRAAIVAASGSLTDATVSTFNAIGMFDRQAHITASADDKVFTPGPDQG